MKTQLKLPPHFLRILALLLFLINTNIISAQIDNQNCSTEDADSLTMANFPWYGNNDWLLNYVDSIESPYHCSNCRFGDGVSRSVYQIPVNIVIYEHNDYPSITNEEAEYYISAVNKIFKNNNVLIHLYLRCDITRKSNSDHARVNTMIEAQNILTSDNEINCLNIHFVSEADDFGGLAKLPWQINKNTLIVSTKYGDRYVPLAHEVGHALGLLHTFQKNDCRADCFQESVSRTRTQENKCLLTKGKKKCSVNGDALCDTDADVYKKTDGDWEDFKNYADCDNKTYNVSSSNPYSNCLKFDNYGEQWYKTGYSNSMKNVMSYFNNNCRQEITWMQKGVMYNYAKHNNHQDFYKNLDLDAYEPDNYWYGKMLNNDENRRQIIDVNSQQYHTFHYAYNENNNWQACDVDWVYFTNNTYPNSTFYIQTLEVSGKPKPDTKITLYQIDFDTREIGIKIDSSDNISTSNQFSRIIHNLPYGNYAIKIENKITDISSNRSKGHYYIRVDECYEKTNIKINGTDVICGSSNPYTITNLPAGSSVTWSVSPSNLATALGFFNNCSVSRVGTVDGFITLTASVVTSCGTTDIFTKAIYVGTPDPTNIIPIAVGSGTLKPNAVYPFTPFPITPPTEANITQFEWQVVTGGTIYNNTQSNNYGQIKTGTIPVGQSESSITVKFRWKGCEWSNWIFYNGRIVKSGGKDPLTPPSFLMQPNPASGEIIIIQQSSSLAKQENSIYELQTDKIISKSVEWIKITDLLGNLKVEKNYSNTEAFNSDKWDVSTWTPGHYIAYIFDGKTIQTIGFIVNH